MSFFWNRRGSLTAFFPFSRSLGRDRSYPQLPDGKLGRRNKLELE